MPRLLRRWFNNATGCGAEHALLAVLAVITTAGCLYPPAAQPKSANYQRTIDVPYDLTWEAALKEMKSLGYTIVVQDPTHGILETEGRGFTLEDADCGIVGSVAGKQRAEPDVGSTSVYNLYLSPHGDEATDVSIQATYATPIRIPFHPQQSQACVSTGRREQALLEVLDSAAHEMRRPKFKPSQS